MKTKSFTYENTDSEPRFLTKRLLAILVVAWLALFAGINTIPLEDHDVFVLQTAREMGENNDWVLPYFRQEPRLNKPPLNYWLTLGISRLDPFSTDIEPWHGRVPSLVSGLLLLLMTAYTGNRLYGGQIGFLAAALLLGTKGFTEFSHCARPDFLYSALCVLQLFAWIAAWRAQDDSWAQRLNAGLGWVLAALATLSKGPQVPAVFLVGFLIFLLCGEQRDRTLKVLRPFSGVLIWLALCLPWWLMLQERVRMLGVNIHETQLSGSLLKKMSGWKEVLSFYYVSRSLILLLPASLLLPLLLFSNRTRLKRSDESDKPLIFTGAAMLIVFSLAGHYRAHYMLPLMPLAVLLLAARADRINVALTAEKMWRVVFWSGTVALTVFPLLLIGRHQFAAALLLAVTGFLLIVLLKKELCEPVWRVHRFTARLAACSLFAAVIFSGFNAFSYNGKLAAEQSFSLSVGSMLRSDDVLMALDDCPHVLPFYTRHTVIPVKGVDDVKQVLSKRGSGQEFYLLVKQNRLSAVNDIFETTTLSHLGTVKSAGNMLHFVRIQSMRP